jgi:hypothetical protein
MKTKPKSPEELYEGLGATYQVVEIALLNSILKAHGIADKRKRRKICEDFLFDLGVIIDEGAFQTERGGRWYAPVPCFTDAPGSPDDGFGRGKKLYKPSDAPFFAFHEYALGDIEHFFKDLSEKTDFDWGPEHE